jgi:hypothetical protein
MTALQKNPFPKPEHLNTLCFTKRGPKTLQFKCYQLLFTSNAVSKNDIIEHLYKYYQSMGELSKSDCMDSGVKVIQRLRSRLAKLYMTIRYCKETKLYRLDWKQ